MKNKFFLIVSVVLVAVIGVGVVSFAADDHLWDNQAFKHPDLWQAEIEFGAELVGMIKEKSPELGVENGIPTSVMTNVLILFAKSHNATADAAAEKDINLAEYHTLMATFYKVLSETLMLMGKSLSEGENRIAELKLELAELKAKFGGGEKLVSKQLTKEINVTGAIMTVSTFKFIDMHLALFAVHKWHVRDQCRDNYGQSCFDAVDRAVNTLSMSMDLIETMTNPFADIVYMTVASGFKHSLE